jgi:predicted AAA+ superfamily ATPase
MKPIEDDKLESVVAAHLARKYPVFYWRNKTEVDVVAIINHRQFGIEVKTGFGSWIKPKHLKDVLVLTRLEVPLFLASIDI